MDRAREELEIYKQVAAMTGMILFRYDISADSMELFFGRMDPLSKYGSVVNDYVEMLRRQQGSDGVDARDYIECLGGNRGYFECRASIRNYNGAVRTYNILGKTDYDDNNNPVYVIGRMDEDDTAANSAGSAGPDYYDRSTGLLNKNGVKDRLNDVCRRKNGADGAFLDIIVDDLKNISKDYPQEVTDGIIINVAGCIKEIFPYDVYIGRKKQDEFQVIYYGGDVHERFMARVDELRRAVREKVRIGNDERNVTVTVGIYRGAFRKGDEYDIMERARVALHVARYRGNDNVEVYYPAMSKVAGEVTPAEDFRYDNVRFDHELVENALDIMSSSGDIAEAINTVFEKIGIKYGIDRIMVHELDPVSKVATVTYEWISPRSEYIKGMIAKTAQAEYDILEKIYSEKEIIVRDDAADAEAGDDVAAKIKALGLKSYVQCVFSDRQKINGCVSFECYEQKHRWKKDELKTFRMITRLISLYLLNMRAYSELLFIKKNRETHDEVTGFYKYDVFLELADEYVKGHPDAEFAVVYAEITDFKLINAKYGYDAGDTLLRKFSDEVRKKSSHIVMGSRMNAGNFAVLVNAYDDRGSRASSATVKLICNQFINECRKAFPDVKIEILSGISYMDVKPDAVDEYVHKARASKG
ncbi:MAG: diguanylate cyclase domain-containing protein [Butyrivibrio sp.]